MYIKGNRQVRQWVIMAAKENNIMPTTEGALDTKYELTMLLDGYPGQEHAIPTVPLYNDVITAYAKSGIEYTPTLIVQYGGPWAENYWFEKELPYNDAKVRHFMPYEELASKTRRRGQGVGAGPGGLVHGRRIHLSENSQGGRGHRESGRHDRDRQPW